MNHKDFTQLPENFRQNILGLHSERGRVWLDNLPHLVAEIAKNWLLTVDEHFPNLSYNFVAPCVSKIDNVKAVLKIGFGETDSIIFSEAEYLNLLGANGAVKLLRFDENRCALLLERLIPGENLLGICETDDGKATAIAIEVMKKLWRKPPLENNFPSLKQWTSSFREAAETEFSQTHFRKARSIFDEFVDSSEQVLLHGDLHHQNILSAERESFLAIDPKGIIGNIGYETAVFLNNPRGWLLSHPDRGKIIEKRLAMFAQNFEIHPLDLRRWAYAEAVLSAWWTFEDNGKGWEKWLACADMWEIEGLI